MTDIGTLTSHIALDTSALEHGHAKSRAIMNQLGSSTGALSSQFGSLGAALGKVGMALGMVGGAAGAIKLLKDSISAGVQSQTVWNDLTAAIMRHGGSWSVVGAQIELFAGGIQRSFGISDEAIAQSIQRFVDYGMTTTTAMDMTRRAIDLSVGAHVDLDTAVRAIARGYAGNTTQLQRLTGVTEESTDASEKFATTMERLSKMFGGAAAAQIGTTALAARTLKESFMEASEAFGKLLSKSAEATGLIGVMDRIGRGAFLMAQDMNALGTTSGRIAELRANLAALNTFQGRAGATVGFGTPVNEAMKIFIAQLRGSVGDIEGLRKRLQEELDALLALQNFRKLITPLENMTNLRERILRGEGMPVGPMSPFRTDAELDAIQEALKKQADAVKEANEELERQAKERGWIKEQLLVAPSAAQWLPSEDEFLSQFKAQEDAIMEILQGANLSGRMRQYYARMLEQSGGMRIEVERGQMIAGGVSSDVANALAAKRMKELAIQVKLFGDRSPEAQRKYEALADAIAGSTQNAVDSMIDGFMRGRLALADIFRGMAEDFISLFLRQIWARVGAKIAGAILGFAMGGPAGAAASALGDWTIGGEVRAKPVVGAEPTYLGRLAPPGGQSSVLVITPPMSVTQEYVRKYVAPELARLARNGARI